MKKENKETFTYATKRTTRDKAAKKAAKEGLTLSEKINQILTEYTRPVKKAKGGVPLPDDYILWNKIGVIDTEGTITPMSK